MVSDAELLRCYVEEASEEAFAALTARHLPLVYSAAIRQVNGDEHLAKDVTQTVFGLLARRARSLSSCQVLSGWLYTTTRFVSVKAMRANTRRRVREREAIAMQQSSESAEKHEWEELSPVLDAAMAELTNAHRTAVLLRFFEGKDLKAVGAALGISEDAARMRVQRGLETLRSVLARRGIISTSAALALTLSTHAVKAAIPLGMAGSVSAAALTFKLGAETASLLPVLEFMATTKMKIALATLVAAGVATPLVLQHQALDRLKKENQLLRVRETAPAVPAITGEPADTEELARLRAEHQELLRLRGQVASLRREKDELVRQAAASGPAKTNPPAKAPATEADLAWVKSMLDSPLAQQGTAAGSLRGKLMRNEPVTAYEFALRDALSKQELNQALERSPSAFADFQTAFIQAAVGINDPAKVAQIHDIVRTTYEHAVAQGLDIPSKPATGAETWVQKRHGLDRHATSALKELLTPEERRLFNRAFIGRDGRRPRHRRGQVQLSTRLFGTSEIKRLTANQGPRPGCRFVPCNGEQRK